MVKVRVTTQKEELEPALEAVCVCVLTWAPAREDLFALLGAFEPRCMDIPLPSLLITKVKGYLKATL
jgi:hypothetical protein